MISLELRGYSAQREFYSIFLKALLLTFKLPAIEIFLFIPATQIEMLANHNNLNSRLLQEFL